MTHRPTEASYRAVSPLSEVAQLREELKEMRAEFAAWLPEAEVLVKRMEKAVREARAMVGMSHRLHFLMRLPLPLGGEEASPPPSQAQPFAVWDLDLPTIISHSTDDLGHQRLHVNVQRTDPHHTLGYRAPQPYELLESAPHMIEHTKMIQHKACHDDPPLDDSNDAVTDRNAKEIDIIQQLRALQDRVREKLLSRKHCEQAGPTSATTSVVAVVFDEAGSGADCLADTGLFKRPWMVHPNEYRDIYGFTPDQIIQLSRSSTAPLTTHLSFCFSPASFVYNVYQSISHWRESSQRGIDNDSADARTFHSANSYRTLLFLKCGGMDRRWHQFVIPTDVEMAYQSFVSAVQNATQPISLNDRESAIGKAFRDYCTSFALLSEGLVLYTSEDFEAMP